MRDDDERTFRFVAFVIVASMLSGFVIGFFACAVGT